MVLLIDGERIYQPKPKTENVSPPSFEPPEPNESSKPSQTTPPSSNDTTKERVKPLRAEDPSDQKFYNMAADHHNEVIEETERLREQAATVSGHPVISQSVNDELAAAEAKLERLNTTRFESLDNQAEELRDEIDTLQGGPPGAARRAEIQAELDQINADAAQFSTAVGIDDEEIEAVFTAMEQGLSPEQAGLPSYLFPPEYRHVFSHTPSIGPRYEDPIGDITTSILESPVYAAASEEQRAQAAGAFLANRLPEELADPSSPLPEVLLEGVGNALDEAAAIDPNVAVHFYNELGPQRTADIPLAILNATEGASDNAGRRELLATYADSFAKATRQDASGGADLQVSAADLIDHDWQSGVNALLIMSDPDIDDAYLANGVSHMLQLWENGGASYDLGMADIFLPRSQSERIEDVRDFGLVLINTPEEAATLVETLEGDDALGALIDPDNGYTGLSRGGAAGEVLALLSDEHEAAAKVIDHIGGLSGDIPEAVAQGADRMFAPNWTALANPHQPGDGHKIVISDLQAETDAEGADLDQFLEVLFASGAGDATQEAVSDGQIAYLSAAMQADPGDTGSVDQLVRTFGRTNARVINAEFAAEHGEAISRDELNKRLKLGTDLLISAAVAVTLPASASAAAGTVAGKVILETAGGEILEFVVTSPAGEWTVSEGTEWILGKGADGTGLLSTDNERDFLRQHLGELSDQAATYSVLGASLAIDQGLVPAPNKPFAEMSDEELDTFLETEIEGHPGVTVGDWAAAIDGLFTWQVSQADYRDLTS